MFRKSLLVCLITLWSLSLAGCEIYFGDDKDDDGYTYCDDTGCYWCDDWGCYPQGGGSDGEGFTCNDNSDCAAGCYCDASGYCQEAGFCTEATEAFDCPMGFECDARGSCVPTSGTCMSDEDCPEGTTCDTATGVCGSDICSDATCGEGWECDETTNTCVPAVPVLCQAEVLCDEAPPTCELGENPGIVDGCWNGECVLDADCPDGAPVECIDHITEADCIADSTCDPVFVGLNCTSPGGESCTSGTANCTCESFRFGECEDAAP